MKRNVIIFSLLVIFFIIFTFVVLVGFQEKDSIKYFETFKFIKKPNKIKEIILINKLSPSEVKGKWHLKVLLDQDNNLIKFENRDKLGNVHETIDTLGSLKVNIQE